jgi:hypothetical protein
MKPHLPAIVAVAVVSSLAFADPAPLAYGKPMRPSIHLDQAQLDAIHALNPQRFARIQEILRVAQAEPCETVPQVLKTQLDVKARCTAYTIYTSFPAKTLLTFTVDSTDYSTFVVQEKLSQGGLVPLK